MKVKDAIENHKVDNIAGFAATEPSASIEEAISLMKRMNIHHLLVKEENLLKGMLSARDVFNLALEIEPLRINNQLSVKDVMRTGVPRIDVEEEFKAVTKGMVENQIDAVFVEKDSEVIGLITVKDLIDILAKRV